MSRITRLSSLAETEASAWNALGDPNHPFMDYAFLRLLETSESVGHGTGWQPEYLVVQEGDTLLGAVPAYEKTDSYGEYIFDWAWAQASEEAGLPYYPKLTVAAPFTPATGARLLARDSAGKRHLAAALREAADTGNLTGAHVLCCTEEEQAILEEEGFLPRVTHQYHWFHHGEASFEDFLARFRSQARKQIKKERRRVRESGLDVAVVRGKDLTEDEWEILYTLYYSTIGRKWGRPYLTRAFFRDAREVLGEQVVVAVARRGAKLVAAALAMEKGTHLYGRYWGTLEPIDGLHFELCYYAFIEYAIDTKKTLFEAGAQGEHKLKRGFEPAPVHSAHWLAHPELHRAVGEFLNHERQAVRRALRKLASYNPYRRQ